MTPRDAIITGLKKSFTLSGRTTRREFWWFAPAALIPVFVVAGQIAWDKFDFFGVWRVMLLMLVPAYLFALFASLFSIGPVIDLLILPSAPDSPRPKRHLFANRKTRQPTALTNTLKTAFTPNPNEVSP